CLQRGVDSPLARTVAMAVAAVLMKNVVLVRPHLATLLFLPCTLVLLNSHRKTVSIIPLVPLPAIFVIWANCHGGFILGAIPFMVVGLDTVTEAWSGAPGSSRRLVQVIVVALLGLVATLLNPHGVDLLAFPFRFDPRAGFLTLVDEWAPPDFKRFPAPEAALLLVVLAPLVWPVRPSPGVLTGLLIALHLGLQAVRNLFLIGQFGAPTLADALWRGEGEEGLLRRLAGRVRLVDQGKGLLLPVALTALLAVPWVGSREFVDGRRFPVAAADWIASSGVSGPLLNEYDQGGYLIWKLGRRHPVFIDGRIEIYSKHGLLADYLELIDAKPGWVQVLDRYAVNLALLRDGSPLAVSIERLPNWRRLFTADGHVVLGRTAPASGGRPVNPMKMNRPEGPSDLRGS
ncbi:MAG: hypothetical protein HY815_24190, partial [Candidatus Riflebacteria bacterium]|nr:hypothetical protein [Candidatus Riflebacteria bacterium]